MSDPASAPRAPARPLARAPGRRGYLDWLRGIAVLIMIEAHTLDSWTLAAERDRAGFGYAMILGGFGAPIFLFLAGIGVALAACGRQRNPESSVPSKQMRLAQHDRRRGVFQQEADSLGRLQYYFPCTGQYKLFIYSMKQWRTKLAFNFFQLMAQC